MTTPVCIAALAQTMSLATLQTPGLEPMCSSTRAGRRSELLKLEVIPEFTFKSWSAAGRKHNMSTLGNDAGARLYRWCRLPELDMLPKLLMLSRLLMLDRLPNDEADDMLDTLSLLLLLRRRPWPPATSNVRV